MNKAYMLVEYSDHKTIMNKSKMLCIDVDIFLYIHIFKVLFNKNAYVQILSIQNL